jgi:branched-chain amino acid transport system permease protein
MQELQVILSGVAQGCIYGLIALGFVLIYKATETVSFTQGELMMLGAFCGLAFVSLFAIALCVGGGRFHVGHGLHRLVD